MMYGGNGWGWGWGVMMFMPLLWIALIGLVVWAVIRLTQPAGKRGTDDRPVARESAREILDRRYAAGEIDTEAYLRARDHLAERKPGSS